MVLAPLCKLFLDWLRLSEGLDADGDKGGVVCPITRFEEANEEGERHCCCLDGAEKART